MISGKLMWFIALQFTIFKDCSCSNTTTDTITEETPPNTTLLAEPQSNISITTFNPNISSTPTPNSTNIDSTHLEIIQIFNGDSSTGLPTEQIFNVTANCLNGTSANCIVQSWNDTLKTNYTTIAEAVGASSEGLPEFRLQNTAAIAAGIFLVSAVIGYFSCVGYRRFLQKKYGNSQILIGEEVYDTTDLRYFEI